jgi:hypothetical protein
MCGRFPVDDAHCCPYRNVYCNSHLNAHRYHSRNVPPNARSWYGGDGGR